MVDINTIKSACDYCKGYDSVSLPQLQYELSLSYTKARELVSFFLEKGWIFKGENAFAVDHSLIPPIRKSDEVCKELVRKIKERKINAQLLEALVKRGSLPISEINDVISVRLKALSTMHARQLQNAGLAYIIDEVLYCTIGEDIFAYLREAGVV